MIAPDCDVVDTENGAQITGDFTADLLKETINNTETGYRRNPKVTCAPICSTASMRPASRLP